MNIQTTLEPHELMPVAVMRCLAIVEYLGRSRSAAAALSLQKAAIFDAALANPNVAKRLLYAMAPEKIASIEFPSVLYPSDVEYGLATNTREITAIATLLNQAALISMNRVDGMLTLAPKDSEALLDVRLLPEHWQSTLKALKTLASKSINTLQQAVIRESNDHAEPHVFIVRASRTQGGDKEL